MAEFEARKEYATEEERKVYYDLKNIDYLKFGVKDRAFKTHRKYDL